MRGTVARHSDAQVREAIRTLADEGLFASKNRLFARFGIACTRDRLLKMRGDMEAYGEIPSIPARSAQFYATRPQNHAHGPYKTPVVIRSSPDQTKTKAPWRPSWAFLDGCPHIARDDDIVHAVCEFRKAWHHLHLPSKPQRPTGVNRDKGFGNIPRQVPDHSRWLNPPIIDKGMPPWHPRGQGI